MNTHELLILDTYITKRRISLKPYSILHFLKEYDKMKIRMVQKKVKKYIISPEECIHCREKKKYYLTTKKRITTSSSFMCKKHVAIYDWSWGKTSQNYGLLNYQDKKFCFFSDYVLTEMNTDSEGLFVLWFSQLDKNKNAIFCIHKKYFSNVFEKGICMDDILNYKYLLYSNWILDMQHIPTLEKINC